MPYTERHADGSLTIHQALPAPVHSLTAQVDQDGRWHVQARGRDATVSWPVDAPHERTPHVGLPRPPVTPARRERAVATVRLADGRNVLCELTGEGVVVRRDAQSGQEIGEPLPTDWEPTLRNAFGRSLRCSGQIVCATGGAGRAVVAAVAGPAVRHDVFVWDADSGEQLGTIRRGDLGIDSVGRIAAACTADGNPVILVSDPVGYVHCLDARSQQRVSQAIAPLGHQGWWDAFVVPVRGGRTLLAVGASYRYHCFDLATGEPVSDPRKPWPLEGFRHAVTRLPDGRTVIVTAGEDGIHRWDVTNAATCPRHPDEHTTTIWDVAVARLADGRAIAAGAGHDGPVYRWDAATGAALGEPLAGHTSSVKAIAATTHPETSTAILVSACEGPEVRCWDADSGKPINEAVQLPGEMITGLDVVDLVDGSRLIVCLDLDGNLHRHDLLTGQALGTPITTGANWPTGLATHLSPAGRPVAQVTFTCDDDSGSTITSWHLDDGTSVEDASSPGDDIVGVFRVDGRMVEVIASGPGTVTIRTEDLNRGT